MQENISVLVGAAIKSTETSRWDETQTYPTNPLAQNKTNTVNEKNTGTLSGDNMKAVKPLVFNKLM